MEMELSSNNGAYGSISISGNKESDSLLEKTSIGGGVDLISIAHPKKGEGEGGENEVPSTIGDISVFCNTINSLLGVSIFAVPWGFSQAGTIGGCLIVFTVAPLCFETTRALLFAQKTLYLQTGEVKSYPEIAASILGTEFGALVKGATATSCLGGCVGYLIFLGEVCGILFDIRFELAIALATFPLVLLSWVRSFRELSALTLVGVFAMIASCGVILIDGLSALRRNDHPDIKVQLINASTGLDFLGPATFMFTIHYICLSMGAEYLVNQDAIRKIEIAALASASSPCSNSTTASAIEDYADSPPVSPSAHTPSSLASSSSVSSTSSSSSLPLDTSPPGILRPLAWSYLLASCVVCFMGTICYYMYKAVDFVEDDEGFLMPGCDARVCQNIILNTSPGPMRTFVGFSLSFSIVFSYILLLVPAREHIELAVMSRIDLCSSEWAVCATKNALRSGLVFFTAMIAIAAPYFGSVLGAVGGITDAFQSFVVPSLIILQLMRDRHTQFEKAFYIAVILWGSATMLFTVYTTVLDIFEVEEEGS